MIPSGEKQPVQPLSPELEAMTRAGVQFGHKTSKTHPKMKPYISGMRNMVHIFDVSKTHAKLREATDALEQLIAGGKKILLVGTKVQIKDLVQTTARACGLPFVSERWIGGTLTNFETITKRLDRLHFLTQHTQSGEFSAHSKKEQLMLQRELGDLQKTYGGLETLTALPDAVFICDLDVNAIAAREAKRKNIAIFALCDADINPVDVQYAIPANDDARSSVQYILSKVQEAVLKVRTRPALSQETAPAQA
ncbi:MAG: 30S ribosomal protein S2 [Candidatus Wildermuthbacteria bacterium]|nr:30S ribosomal protein S2 [Candidatus Wildermuthbacteria bacterium]